MYKMINMYLSKVNYTFIYKIFLLIRYLLYYAFLGSLRSTAQLVSYELILSLAIY
jgi:NADH:ubiquinone oxidoreductase subunit H